MEKVEQLLTDYGVAAAEFYSADLTKATPTQAAVKRDRFLMLRRQLLKEFMRLKETK